VGQIGRLLDVLRLDRVDVVGFGWGGRLGRELKVRCRERVRKLRTAATGLRKYWVEADKDPERLRRRLAASLPSGLREDRRRELEYFLALVPARNLVRVYEPIEGEATADDFWPTPPGDPDQIWRELADPPHSEVE
jgi:pimeloyl-ACP methyl ester carboxylesterase